MRTNESRDAYLPTRTYAAQIAGTMVIIVAVTMMLVVVSSG